MKIFISLCVILSLLSEDSRRTLYAQEAILPQEVSFSPVSVSLEEALARVKKIHPGLRLQEIAVKRAREEVRLASRAFLPDIDMDLIATSAAGGFGLIVAMARILRPIFSLKTLLTERKIRKLLEEKEKILIRARELEVEQGVKELYAALLIQEKLAELLQRKERLTEERYRLKKIHHHRGGVTDEELFKEKLLLQKARFESTQARALFAQSGLALRILLGIPKEVSFSLLTPEFNEEEEFPLTLHECFILAGERNPVVKSLRLTEAASKKERDKTKARFIVDGLFIGLGESGDLFQGRPRVGLQGNLTLYDWGKKGIRNKLRGLNHETLLLQDQKELEALARVVAKDYFDLGVLKSERETLGSALRLKREERRRGRILVRMGRVRPEETLKAEGEYLEASGELFGKRLEYFLAREKLLKELGLSGMREFKEVLGR